MALSFPTVRARIQPSDSLIPFVRRFGPPSRATYLDGNASSLRASFEVRPAVRAFPASGASESGHRVSVAPVVYIKEE